ncbi:COG0762 Predicted integral membrane protein [Acidimicrobiia bacterium]
MAQLIYVVVQLFLLCLLGRIVLSWFPPSGPGPLESIRQVLFRITEPVLGPIRRLLPPVRMGGMGLDLSPMIVFLVLQILISALR